MIKFKQHGCLWFAVLLLLIGGFYGCVRAALPTYSSELESGVLAQRERRLTRQISLPLVELSAVAPPLGGISDWASGSELGETIGHQYVFLLFPFTSVYFPHGVQQELEETARDVLVERGYVVMSSPRSASLEATAKEDSVHRLPSQNEPRSHSLITKISIGIDSPRLNAWDLYFFRRVTIRGTLMFKLERPGHPPKALSREIETTLYRRYAYGPALAYAFHKGIREELTKIFTEIDEESRFEYRAKLKGGLSLDQHGDSSQQLLVLLPFLEAGFPEGYGEFVANSSGYPQSLSYSEKALVRMLQRGLLNGVPADVVAQDVSTSRLELLEASNAALLLGTSPWVLSTRIRVESPLQEKLDGDNGENGKVMAWKESAERELRFGVDLRLDELTKTGPKSVMAQSCRVKQQIDWSGDEPLVRTLETALRPLTQRLFHLGDIDRGSESENRAVQISCDEPKSPEEKE